ncbi:MAG: DUF1453 domain-containing protein [Verrucomicrobiaceae bacterium]|nr:MAG: DUF1453 domain-containing protein [Verrucomicrobiaceae bacterium]
MPLLFIPLLLILLPAVIALTVPLSVIQRYRAGTARRPARGWVAATNLFFMVISVTLFLVTAAISSTWVPGAFTYSMWGMVGGCLLGLVGLALSHWEETPQSLHYTPNRWLVLSITLIITVRLGFGFWRAWQAWRYTPDEQSWLAASGLAGSMAVGAVVLGYYFTYWAGVWRRARQHRRGSAK